jgi:hypothetical protein
MANSNWKYAGCSDQSVPSLSKTAIRSDSGTKSAPPGVDTRTTKSMIPSRVAPAFHDGNASGSLS